MSELEISSNTVIDDVDEVIKHLARQLDLPLSQTVNLDKIKEFILYQDKTQFYIDEKLNVKTADDKTPYLWLDTGLLTSSGDAIFISLVNTGGFYYGHIVGDYKYLANVILEYFPHSRRAINDNKSRFKGRYDKIICRRATAHLFKHDVAVVNSALFLETRENVPSIVYDVVNNADDILSGIVPVVKDLLMFDNWKSDAGLDRYLKICGTRLSQLIEQDMTDYYTFNGTHAVINTGLFNRFGLDIYVMYKVTCTDTYEFTSCAVVEGKSDMISKGFSRDEASRELLPITFFNYGEPEVFTAAMSDFDVSTSALMHIIGTRRERFPENMNDVSDSMIVSKIMQALEIGVKIQARDHSYIKPVYSGKAKAVAWVFPLHINRSLTEQPELALIVRRRDCFYEIKTIISYDDIVLDRLRCLSLYS